MRLKKFLTLILGVDERISEEDACRIEHYIHPKTLDYILKFDFFE